MAEEMNVSEKESWMNAKWRPAMGWMYMAVCITDFILYPVLWAIFQASNHITPVKPWDPLTLQGAGLFHIAMGAVLGVAAFGRTQEKLAGANNGGLTTSTSGSTTPSISQTGFSAPSGNFSSPSTGTSPSGFGSVPTTTSGFGSSSGFGAATTPTLTSSGKKVVPDFPQPEI